MLSVFIRGQLVVWREDIKEQVQLDMLQILKEYFGIGPFRVVNIIGTPKYDENTKIWFQPIIIQTDRGLRRVSNVWVDLAAD